MGLFAVMSDKGINQMGVPLSDKLNSTISALANLILDSLSDALVPRHADYFAAVIHPLLNQRTPVRCP
jgi:hypothetical protein